MRSEIAEPNLVGILKSHRSTDQLFPQERDETPGCLFNPTPEDTINFTTAAGSTNAAALSDIEAFADFMRMLAPPTPAPSTPSTEKGRATFVSIGCVHCHTQMIASSRGVGPKRNWRRLAANLVPSRFPSGRGSSFVLPRLQFRRPVGWFLNSAIHLSKTNWLCWTSMNSP